MQLSHFLRLTDRCVNTPLNQDSFFYLTITLQVISSGRMRNSWSFKRKNFNHRKSRLHTALMLKATQSYLSGTCTCCMHNPSKQEITRKCHVKREKKIPPSEFLEARLSSLATFHLATVSNCHGQWNAQHTSVSELGFMCNVRLILNKITWA